MNIGLTTVKCAACGHEFETTECMSSHFFGSPNLDGRADDGTLEFASTICPKCGYVAPDIEEENEISKNWTSIKNQLEIGAIRNKSNEFFALYKIADYKNDLEEKYSYLLRTCWADEDSLVSKIFSINSNEVINHRNLLISLTSEIVQNLEDEDEIAEYELRAIDFLRRNKKFDEAIEKANKFINSSNEVYSSIAKYQIKLCNDKSTKIDTIDVAMKYSKDSDKYEQIKIKLAVYKNPDEIMKIIRQILDEKGDDEEFYKLINLSIEKNEDDDTLLRSLNSLKKLEVVNHEFK